MLCIACSHGFGLRSRFVSPSDRRTVLRLVFIIQIIWYWSLTLVKLSVALLLLRLKPGRTWRIFLHSIIALLFLTLIAQTLFPFLQCRPFSIYWDPSAFSNPGNVTCIPRDIITANIIANSTINVTTDLILSFVPITFIRKLRRPRSEKIFLSILMALGLGASTFAILRTAGLRTFNRDKEDFLRGNVMPVLWATLEQEVAMIAATVPTLRSLGQNVLVRAGKFFYEEESETKIRARLVELGFLRTIEQDGSYQSFRWGRKLSKPDIEVGGFVTENNEDEVRDTDFEKEGTVITVEETK
jgi:hypothetical protein